MRPEREAPARSQRVRRGYPRRSPRGPRGRGGVTSVTVSPRCRGPRRGIENGHPHGPHPRGAPVAPSSRGSLSRPWAHPVRRSASRSRRARAEHLAKTPDERSTTTGAPKSVRSQRSGPRGACTCAHDREACARSRLHIRLSSFSNYTSPCQYGTNTVITHPTYTL